MQKGVAVTLRYPRGPNPGTDCKHLSSRRRIVHLRGRKKAYCGLYGRTAAKGGGGWDRTLALGVAVRRANRYTTASYRWSCLRFGYFCYASDVTWNFINSFVHKFMFLNSARNYLSTLFAETRFLIIS